MDTDEPGLRNGSAGRRFTPPAREVSLGHHGGWLMLAESHLTRRLFGSMVRRIGTLAVATG